MKFTLLLLNSKHNRVSKNNAPLRVLKDEMVSGVFLKVTKTNRCGYVLHDMTGLLTSFSSQELACH